MYVSGIQKAQQKRLHGIELTSSPHSPPQPLAIFFLLLLHDRIHFSINSSFSLIQLLLRKLKE